MKRTSGLPLNVSESLHHRLNSYALAATAAGVGALAFALPGEGKIIYTRTNHVIDRNHPEHEIYLTNNHEASDAEIRYSFSSSRGLYRRALFAVGNVANTVEDRRPVALALKAGSKIGSSLNFGNSFRTHTMAEKRITTGTMETQTFGYWFNVSRRYVGLEFRINGKIHFGWLRLSTQTSDDYSATLTGYAYETIPNKPIIAGKTKGPDVVTVQPASLGHLAHGAASISAWRGQH